MSSDQGFVANYDDCTHVTHQCPVSATTYGYAPNLPGNIFLCVWFGVLLVVGLTLGIRSRTWTYTIALGIGAAFETMGYVGRILLHANPWGQGVFSLQVVGLILAPSFLAACVYLTLKHLVLFFGPEHSLIRARWYPWIFVGCDIGSIVLQAIGGGLAAAGGNGNINVMLLNNGDRLIIVGIAFQVVTMLVCGLFAGIYFFRYRKAQRSLAAEKEGSNDADTADAMTRRKLSIFCAAIAAAYFTILIRCIYRLPEMAGGWGNPRMQDETTFLILDGTMVAVATLLLTVVHPALFFKRMCKGGTQGVGDNIESRVAESR